MGRQIAPSYENTINLPFKSCWSATLLILNSYRSHLTIEFINYYNNNKILLIIYLFYLTHLLQLLNIRIFSPLTTIYSK